MIWALNQMSGIAEVDLRATAEIFNVSHDGIVIIGPDACVRDVNPAFTRITGYTRAEVLGRRTTMWISGQQNSAFYKALWARLHETGQWSGELVNRRKDGSLYTQHLNLVAVHDAQGLLLCYIGSFADITQSKAHEQHLLHLAHHDALTDLPNRRLLTERITLALERSAREGQRVALLYLDLDDFKPVNDRHGHGVGDQVLIEVGRRLCQVLRVDDTVARIGGDEFVVLLDGVGSHRECEAMAQRLLGSLFGGVAAVPHRVDVSASVGICLYPDDEGADADAMLRQAHQAMYRAKELGANQFVFFGQAARNSRANARMAKALRQALPTGQIRVHYQPIVDLGSGQVVKAEALVRWCHPQKGWVSPAEFIPVAEASGVIHALGDLVLRDVLRVAQTLHARAAAGLDAPLSISINRSPREFLRPESTERCIQQLLNAGIPGQCLCVEITEGLLIDDAANVREQLAALRAVGVAVALDDFGTGYSALGYLKKFDIDVLKIDRSFIRDIAIDPSDRAIVEAIIVMARRLGIRVVAEGVETVDQARMLADADCDMAQGYLYARPMPETEFLAYCQAAAEYRLASADPWVQPNAIGAQRCG